MPNLNREEIAAYDHSGMLERILGMSQQLQGAVEISRRVDWGAAASPPSAVCFGGMGGSAISGDLVRSYLQDRVHVPMAVSRYYSLPAFVNENTLVFLTSYSGNTEETLSAYDLAAQRQARIVCITSGGVLGERARADGCPVVAIPSGHPPRSALGYLTVPLLYGLMAAGCVTEDLESEIQATIEELGRLAEIYAPERDDNLAKTIAHKLEGKIPLVYSSVQNFEAVGLRWKGQLSENSKVLAFANVFPELNHNEIVGWGPRRELSRLFQVIYLKDREDHPQIQKRMGITREIIEQHSEPVIEVESSGASRLARIFSLIFLGDMVSLYLAVLNRVDPTPVANIDLLKSKL